MKKAWASYKSLPVSSNESSSASHLPSQPLDPLLAGIFPNKRKWGVDASLDDELEEYLREPPEDASICPLAYWKNKMSIWPRLTCMASDYLAVMASSASSERVFSAGRDLLGITRFNMKPNTMEACILLRSWIRAGLLKAEHVGKGMMEPMVLSIDCESEEGSGESNGGNGDANQGGTQSHSSSDIGDEGEK